MEQYNDTVNQVKFDNLEHELAGVRDAHQRLCEKVETVMLQQATTNTQYASIIGSLTELKTDIASLKAGPTIEKDKASNWDIIIKTLITVLVTSFITLFLSGLI